MRVELSRFHLPGSGVLFTVSQQAGLTLIGIPLCHPCSSCLQQGGRRVSQYLCRFGAPSRLPQPLYVLPRLSP